MNISFRKALLLAALLCVSAHAEKATVKIGDIDTKDNQDTAILIQKGGKGVVKNCEAEIVSGSAEIAGDPAYSRADALGNFKNAREEWRREVRNTGPNSEFITSSCGTPSVNKEADQYTASSRCEYKIRVTLSAGSQATKK